MLKKTPWIETFCLAALLSVAAHAFADEPEPTTGVLSVRIWNIQSDKGQIGCSLYSKSDGFPSDSAKADQRMFVRLAEGKATCTFQGVQPGVYAVSVMHDEDKNEKLKTSMVGRPQEWWGVSNDVPPERFGPPKYDKATFKFDGGSKAIKVKLRR